MTKFDQIGQHVAYIEVSVGISSVYSLLANEGSDESCRVPISLMFQALHISLWLQVITAAGGGSSVEVLVNPAYKAFSLQTMP